MSINTIRPWKLEIKNGHHTVKAGNGCEICFMNCQNVNIANEEKLITAAPDLFRALEVCWKSLQTYGEHPIIKEQVEKAINKASVTVTRY